MAVTASVQRFSGEVVGRDPVPPIVAERDRLRREIGIGTHDAAPAPATADPEHNRARIGAFLVAIRAAEHGGDTGAGTYDTASDARCAAQGLPGSWDVDACRFGAYQFDQSEWRDATASAGTDPGDLSPANQDAAARAHFLDLFDRYGSWADVASVWNTGSPNHAGTDNYRGRAMAAFRKALSAGISASDAAAASAANVLGALFPAGIAPTIPKGGHFGDDRPGGRKHAGVDYDVPDGTAVLAPVPGTITNLGPIGGFGEWVTERAADGRTYVFGHVVADPSLSVGSPVAAGATVGHVAVVGDSTGPHLHFEVHDASGNVLDPTKLGIGSAGTGATEAGVLNIPGLRGGLNAIEGVVVRPLVDAVMRGLRDLAEMILGAYLILLGIRMIMGDLGGRPATLDTPRPSLPRISGSVG